MRSSPLFHTALLAIVLGCGPAAMAEAPPKDATAKAEPKADAPLPRHFTPQETATTGSVVVGRQRVDYRAIAGTLVVHPRGWDDVTAKVQIEAQPAKSDKPDEDARPPAPKPVLAEASMFYVAYFKQGAPAASRPVTFLYNGGPGSPTVWLHMGAFGPRRVVTPGDQHLPAAPYVTANNAFSLLDASDLVFIDAPGTGFSRVAGPEKEKAFYGVDADAWAFAEFITQFLTKFGRWNSPKYLFGESYGTTRSAVLINELESGRLVDFNGVILLSQILNFRFSADDADQDPGLDLPYELALPTYAATAFYHHKLGSDVPHDLKQLLAEVERFAVGDYALALQQGAALPAADRQRIAQTLQRYTGIPAATILKADLRITGGVFEKNLDDANDETTGRIDTRFAGPAMDPLEKEAGYDPFVASVGSAYTSAFNDYARETLKVGGDTAFQPLKSLWKVWTFEHTVQGEERASHRGLNVMRDLAKAMKYNPRLKVMLNAGYYDLATPYFEGVYEMRHLPMPEKLQANIAYRFYESGHMVYAEDASLKELHDSVAAFIRDTSGAGAKGP